MQNRKESTRRLPAGPALSHWQRVLRLAGLSVALASFVACVADVELLGPGLSVDTVVEEELLTDAGATEAGLDAATSEPAIDCEPGAVRCELGAVQVCDEDVGWDVQLVCDSQALCIADVGQRARCLERACNPGRVCQGAELVECNDELTGYDSVCVGPSELYCDAMLGACRDAACVDGRVSCNGGTLQRCNVPEDRFDELVTCQTPQICEDLLAETCGEDLDGCVVPDDVQCDVPVCEEVGELRCDGRRLEACREGRNGWDLLDECVSEGVCNLTLSDSAAIQCVPAPCQPGATICSDEGTIVECNAEQTQYTVDIAQCRSAAYCRPGERACAAEPCVNGELACNGSVLQQCQEFDDGADIGFSDVDDCLTRELCEGSLGSALPPACQPPRCGEGQLQCASRQLQRCNAGRTAFENVPDGLCQTEELCEIAAVQGSCPAPCEGFECRGETGQLFGCNAGLTELELQETCGSSAECDSVAGSCADPCVPGGLRCNGAALEECVDPTLGWQRRETCVSDGLCQASVGRGQSACEAPACEASEHRCVGQTLQVCSQERTEFIDLQICDGNQICDAENQQCDNCVANSVACRGDTFVSCGQNGQEESQIVCGAGLCSSAGANVGCLQCLQADGFRCDNLGSLLQCASDQQQENQLDVCRQPQLCDPDQGLCLACDPPGSSRCDGAEILTCTDTNQEISGGTCASAALCVPSSASTVECEDDRCPQEFQCTSSGEVLVCNADRTGYVSQSPSVTCVTPALCDVTEPDGCAPPVCAVGDTRCTEASDLVEVCNSDRSGFRNQELCAVGFSCVASSVTTAACECVPGEYRCSDAGLEQCAADGGEFVSVVGGFACEGAERVSCNARAVERADCGEARLCEASTGASCAACAVDADCVDGLLCTSDACVGGICQQEPVPCPSDGDACTGVESCDPATGACVSSGNPCSGADSVCLEGGVCVECGSDADCGGATPVCDVSNHACVGCVVSGDCGGATPACDVSTNACVECVVSGDCGGATPACDVSTNACVECLDPEDCSDGDLCTEDVCSPAGVCTNPAVVCVDDGQACTGVEACDPGSGACTSSGSACAGATPVCLEPDGSCVECEQDDDCGADAPLCDQATNVCVP